MVRIQILGTGCARCKKLTENAQAAAAELGAEFTVEKVTDINEIMKFKVWQTPGLAVDGSVKSVGKVLSTQEIKSILNASSANADGR